ncbi:MAG: ABC transporter ATP-binding protein [bacterium]
MNEDKVIPKKPEKIDLIGFFKPYTRLIIATILAVVVSNALNLLIPRMIGTSLDHFQLNPGFNLSSDFIFLGLVLVGIFLATLVQIYLSAYTSEKIASDYRFKLIDKLSRQSFGYITKTKPSDLLTNVTSDVDAIKNLVSQGLVNALSALILLVGSVTLLLSINLKLGLIAISVLPILIVAFIFVFSRITKYFKLAQENLSKINKVINESVMGSMLIRVLNSQSLEQAKFEKVNQTSKEIGYKIIDSFSALIPIVNLVSNLAVVIIIWFGGNLVVSGELSLGQFSAFISYFNLLITPIFILGFISNLISRSFVSLGRINKVLNAPLESNQTGSGQVSQKIKGKIEFKKVSLEYSGRQVLDELSFVIEPGTKNAILGPTAAGKTQIFSLLTGLVKPSSGEILIDDVPLGDWNLDSLLSQMGLVFQDSVVFNTSLKENIQFKDGLDQKAVDMAIKTAELDELISSLKNGLQTQVSERGTNLSGGQKQRLMLARSLVIKPKILLLDDFTARVDIQTEKQILANLEKNYPGLTLVSITQKIQPITAYDQILLLMQGELLATGKHQKLIQDSIEYQQIYKSQQSTD